MVGSDWYAPDPQRTNSLGVLGFSEKGLTGEVLIPGGNKCVYGLKKGILQAGYSLIVLPEGPQMKVHFGTKKVQKMGRIALTEQLLRNAGLQEGDSVDLYFDATTKAIIVERSTSADEHSSTVDTKPAGTKQPRKKS